MQKLIKFEWNGRRYWPQKKSHPKMDLIGILFSTDIGCPADRFFIDWLDNPNSWGAGGNATTVDLLKNGTVEIRDVLDKEQGPVFVMPKEEYRKMVLEWQELCKHRPREIIITWDGKEVTVEGRN